MYHILKDKKCFPEGCFYFRWHCKQLSKHKRCHRGFSHVGRKCTGCRYFRENKIHRYPELQVNRDAYRGFLRELDRFEDWLAENEDRHIECAGTVSGVKPLFTKKIFPGTHHLSFRGYLVMFKEIYLGREHLQDFVYARLSGRYYGRLRLGTGDRIEGRARLKTDRGRMVLYRMKGVEVLSRGEPGLWNNQKVLLARETATEFSGQPEECVQCPFGALVDVEDLRNHSSLPRRSLLCLKGIQDFRDCYLTAGYCDLDNGETKLAAENCDNVENVFIP